MGYLFVPKLTPGLPGFLSARYLCTGDLFAQVFIPMNKPTGYLLVPGLMSCPSTQATSQVQTAPSEMVGDPEQTNQEPSCKESMAQQSGSTHGCSPHGSGPERS